MNIDLHVHTNVSLDSKIKIGILLRKLKTIGLDAIAITDHNTMEGLPKAKEIAEKYGVKVFAGVEISTKKGHVLAYGVEGRIPYRKSVVETIEWVQEQGGAIICAHPFRYSSPSIRDNIYNYKFDGVEINARCNLSQNRAAELAAKVMNITLVGGSDAHFEYKVGTIYTEFVDEITNEDELVAAIRKGRCKAHYKIPESIKAELIKAIPTAELHTLTPEMEEGKRAVAVLEGVSKKPHFMDSEQEKQ